MPILTSAVAQDHITKGVRTANSASRASEDREVTPRFPATRNTFEPGLNFGREVIDYRTGPAIKVLPLLPPHGRLRESAVQSLCHAEWHELIAARVHDQHPQLRFGSVQRGLE